LSHENYRDNLQQVITKILQKAKPTTQIAVCTLPPLGEDLTRPENTDIIHRANQTIAEVVHSIASNRVKLLPVNESLVAQIEKATATTPLPAHPVPVTDFMRIVPEMAIRVHLFGQGYESVSAKNGMHVLSDALHLNETGAQIVARLVLDWLQPAAGN